MNQNKTKTTKCVFDTKARLVTAVFALSLAIPAVGSFFADHKARSAWENRPLAVLSVQAIAKSGLYPFRTLEGYLNDHFGFALPLGRLYRQLVFYVFRDSPTPDISIGKDGYTFLTSFKSEPFSMLENICIHGMDADTGRRASDAWVKVLDTFADSHKHVALLIAPSKPILYPEKLPAAVPRRYRDACARYNGEHSVAASIVSSVQESGQFALYPFREFLDHKYEGNFHPRENVHFGGASAHRFGRLALNGLGISVNTEYEERLSDAPTGDDLKKMLGFTRTIVADAYPYNSFSISWSSGPAFIEEYFERVRHYGTWTTTGNPLSSRTALLVGNSYTGFIAKHLAAGYKSLTLISINGLQEKEYARFFSELVPRIGADDLIFMYNDTNLADEALRLRKNLSELIISRSSIAKSRLPEINFSEGVVFSKALDENYLSGFWGAEMWGRWTAEKEASFYLQSLHEVCQSHYLNLGILRFYEGVNPGSLEVLLNGEKLNVVSGMEDGSISILYDCSRIYADESEPSKITISVDKVVSPSSISDSGDPRTLGIGLKFVKFVAK